MKASEIRAEIVKMDAAKKKYRYMKSIDFPEYCRKVADEVPTLATEYDQIFTKHIHDDMDMKMFNFMLDTLEKRENGVLTEADADAKIGSRINKKYVAPALQKLGDPSLNNLF